MCILGSVYFIQPMCFIQDLCCPAFLKTVTVNMSADAKYNSHITIDHECEHNHFVSSGNTTMQQGNAKKTDGADKH